MHTTRIVAVCLTTVLAMLAGTARAEYVLFDDFTDEALGPIGGQDGWYSGGGNNAVVVDPGDPSNQCMYVPSESSILRKALAAEDLSFPDNTSRMMFFRMRVANKQTFSMGLSPYSSPSEYSDFANEIGIANSAPNLDLRAWDDDGGNYETLYQLTADVWYNVWVRIDTLDNLYEIWLNGTPSAGATSADKLAASDLDETFEFRTGSTSALQTFYIKTSGGSSGFGPVYFDDVYLETTSALNLYNPTVLLPGDCNCDGVADVFDIDAFVMAIISPLDYEATYPNCTIVNADCNGDGATDVFDIDAFVGIITGD
ncbi:MAG: hypothetical protein JXO22_07980 [Phycisphaerae bacterium]|nr:hypothetical protein [Phycisphaerae bacterium]